MNLSWQRPLGLSPQRYRTARLVPAVTSGLGYIASEMERYAKTNAPWTDRTGAARRGLHGYVLRISHTRYAAVIAHGRLVPYGGALEARPHTAILRQTLSLHAPRTWPAIRRLLQGTGRLR